MTGIETGNHPATRSELRIEAAARALAIEAVPETENEHWEDRTQWFKDIYRRRAALALAAADEVDALSTAAPGGSSRTVSAGGDCDGDCRGSRCSYCGCCIHTIDAGHCRTSAAPAGMRCPDSGCGCEGTAA